jgi:O-6-methylguanine DNA methyltransferase
MDQIYYATFDSPIGPIWTAWTDQGVHLVQFGGEPGAFRENIRRNVAENCHVTETAGGQVTIELSEYFARTRERFTVPLRPRGTSFDMRVWKALRTIPFGETRSYADIATQIGQREAVRAVGRANGRNPVPILIPCHRVIRRNGSLGGYSSGLPIKRWLLQHERGVAGRGGSA